MPNITVSAWNSSSIEYIPQNCSGSGWPVNTKEGGSECYRSCTLSSKTPSAKLSFTGSAVYYISAYFNNQSIEFILDGVRTANVSLALPTGISAYSNLSRVMWYAQGLQEVKHTLELFPVNNGSTLSVDTIVFTTNQTLVSSPSSMSTSSSIPPITPSSLAVNGARIVVDNQTIGLVIGATAGSISGLILLGLLVMMCFRTRNLNDARRYRSFSRGSSHGTSLHHRSQRSHITVHTMVEEPSFSRHPDHIQPLPISQQAGPSAGRQVIQSPYSDMELKPRENQWHSDTTNRANEGTVDYCAPPKYPKLEPLRKAPVR